jgi:hypothetical protein
MSPPGRLAALTFRPMPTPSISALHVFLIPVTGLAAWPE